METNTQYLDSLVDHWSYSSMSSLLSNPFAFKKKYVFKIYDDISSPSAVVGKAAHKCMEMYFKGMEIHEAIQAGLMQINETSDMGIDYGKKGSREAILKTYNQAVNFYFAEIPTYHEILGVELSLTKEIETVGDKPQKLSLPAKAISDLVTRNKLGEIEIIDHKFIASYTNGDEDNFNHFIQAMFNYHVVKAEFGEAPARMVFNEVKVSKNTKENEGMPQLQPYIVDFRNTPMADFAAFYKLYESCTHLVNLPGMVFLPNPRDIFDGQNSFELFRAGTMEVERPTAVKHKTEQVAFQDKQYIASAFDKVENQDLSPEERIRLKLQEFGISVDMRETFTGPSVIKYTMKPSRGVRMSQIDKLAKDLALALEVASIRVEAPMYGTGLVGVEVPSLIRKRIDLAESHLTKGTMQLPIGINVYGELVKKDLTDMPHLLIAGSSGCHAKGEKVLMFDGSIKSVENVQIGDMLMGDDSTPRAVLELHRGRHKMAKISSRWGTMTLTTNHVLSLQHTSTKKITNITIEEYIQKNRNFKFINKLYRKPVEFTRSDSQTIPPYILGLWLGDGTNRMAAITSPDEECLKEWEEWGISIGLKTRREYRNNCATSHITTGSNYGSNNGRWRRGNNTAKNMLEDLGVLNNKHVPKEYLIADRNQRLELLAGLVDSDGYLEVGKGSIDYTTKYKALGDDIKYLCLSLGLSCSLVPCKKGFMRADKTRFTGDYYRLHIGGDIRFIPNRLRRKHHERIPVQYYGSRAAFKVDLLDEDDYYGFRVDSNHLYMTDDFVVTHNSGKSVMLNVILTSLTKQMSPDLMKLILIDPKRVELSQFKAVPHLAQPIIFDDSEAATALDYLVDMMEARYTVLEKAGYRFIDDYNEKNRGKELPKVVLVIDEYADLILNGGKDERVIEVFEGIGPRGGEISHVEKKPSIETQIVRLAQKARAVGIHLILATQRPSADVVTGLIRSNFAAKIAFMTSTAVNSRIIIDQDGAEELIGKGDMLFVDPSKQAPIRLQGLYS